MQDVPLPSDCSELFMVVEVVVIHLVAVSIPNILLTLEQNPTKYSIFPLKFRTKNFNNFFGGKNCKS